jgi:hypothetical protein
MKNRGGEQPRIGRFGRVSCDLVALRNGVRRGKCQEIGRIALVQVQPSRCAWS